MNTQLILRLLKAVIFILAFISYRFVSGIASQIVFAIALALYILELYKGERKWISKKH